MPPEPQPLDPKKETIKPAPVPLPTPVAVPVPAPAPAPVPAPPLVPVPPPNPTPAVATPASTPVSAMTAVPAPGEIDIDDILLPQKEVRKVESQRRVSAGVLLDQEQKAGDVGIPKPPTASKSSVPKPATAAPPETSSLKALETYQGDIEHVMQGGDVSIVSIAAAEAQRRAQRGRVDVIPEEDAVPFRDRALAFIKKFSMVGAGIILLVVAVAAIAFVSLRSTTSPVATAPVSPFISVDDTKSVVISPNTPGRILMDNLNTAKQNVSLSLGLIERLVPSVSSTTANGETITAMDVQSFLSKLAPNIPPTLLRTLAPTYLLGVHVYDTNQPFLILRVDSYQEAFSGMLSWEFYLKSDLAPLFSYVPSPRINKIAVPPATPAASTTPASVEASTSPALAPPVIPQNFIDKIVENHDARVLQNEAGDVYLLWTFLDRNTLVITTNAATLREIISRLQQAPVTVISQ